MRGDTAFAEVLEEKLSEFATFSAKPDAKTWSRPRVTPPNPFLFVTPQRPFRASPYQVTPSDAAPSSQKRPFAPPPPAAASSPSPRPQPQPRPVTPLRSLTASQERALDAFVALGSRLTVDFTARELRSAFLGLARQYHPDRHPASDDVEKAQLARVFADLAEHHRQLLTVLETAKSQRR